MIQRKLYSQEQPSARFPSWDRLNLCFIILFSRSWQQQDYTHTVVNPIMAYRSEQNKVAVAMVDTQNIYITYFPHSLSILPLHIFNTPRLLFFYINFLCCLHAHLSCCIYCCCFIIIPFVLFVYNTSHGRRTCTTEAYVKVDDNIYGRLWHDNYRTFVTYNLIECVKYERDFFFFGCVSLSKMLDPDNVILKLTVLIKSDDA